MAGHNDDSVLKFVNWIGSGANETVDPETAQRQWAAAVRYIESGAPATLATINKDGRPQQSVVWVGVEGTELVLGHTLDYLKLKNIRRDPRVSLSFASGSKNQFGIFEYLVIEGTARVTEGGARELLTRLAATYVDTSIEQPPVDQMNDGWITRITPTRVRGWGPWQEANPM